MTIFHVECRVKNYGNPCSFVEVKIVHFGMAREEEDEMMAAASADATASTTLNRFSSPLSDSRN